MDCIYGVVDPFSEDVERDPISDTVIDVVQHKLPVVLIDDRISLSYITLLRATKAFTQL